MHRVLVTNLGCGCESLTHQARMMSGRSYSVSDYAVSATAISLIEGF